ncbi:MAG: NADH:ubiquinone oxidoreductase [Pseudomonadota bacterium]
MIKQNPWSCTVTCWVVAFLIGAVAAALLYFLGDYRAVQAIAVGIFALLIVGFVLTRLACGDNAWGAIPAEGDQAASSAPAPMVAPVASAPAPAAAKPAPKKAPAKKAPAKKAAAKPKPPVLFESRPDEVDDLKLISGVGPKLEEKLHDVGVYQFKQIANWKKADVAMVDDKLSFKGRIDRDEWIAQAKILAKGGDTEFSAKKRK